MLALSSPILELLNEKVIEITRSPEEQRLFDSRMKMRSDILTGLEVKFKEGIKLGIEKGIEKGREEGSYKAKLETAKKLLDMGMPIENIAIATGLTQGEIEKLNSQ